MEAMDLLPEEVGRFYREGILHSYVETLYWNRDGLIVRAFGDRERNPMTFDVTLKCTVKKYKWTCKKTPANKTVHQTRKTTRRVGNLCVYVGNARKFFAFPYL